MVVNDLKAKTLMPILRANISEEATIYTDEANQYRGLGRVFADHDFVRYSADQWTKPVASTPAPSRAGSASSSGA